MPHALACLALIAILAAASVSAAAAERCAEVVGRVAAAEPRVEVVLGPDRRALAPDEALCAGDILTSSNGERAVVVLRGGGTIQLAPGSTVKIDGQAKEGRTVIRLLRGIIRLFGRRQPLEVDTPFADAAVEGTEFAVALEPDRTRVAVLEGRVRVSNPRGALRLDAGQVAVAVAGRAPELELRIRPRDAVRWTLYYPPLGEARLPPGTPAAVREAARLEAEGQRAEALARLDAVPPGARDATYQTLRAGLLLGTGRPEEAGAALAEALRQQPDDADALAVRSVMAVAANDKERALADARRAVELAPRSARARLALSYAAQASFDIPLARKSLEAAVKAEPEDALAWARLAETQLMEGDVRAATRSAARAVALDPTSARAQTVQGFVALARIDTRAAKADFARALEFQSFSPLARLGLGLATIRDGDLAAGREQIELAVALDPDDALLRSYLGKAYLEERKDRLASDELETAKALDPNDPTPWFYNALGKERDNEPVAALRSLEESIALNNNRAVYRSRLLLDQDRASRGVSLAQIYRDLGFDRLGELTASWSLAEDPTNYSAHRFLSDSFALRPRNEIARDSELLLSRLLEPVATRPIDPKRASENTALGARFFTAPDGLDIDRLFEQDSLRLHAEGGGGQDILTEELAGAILYRNFALSPSQFYYQDQGVRLNNDREIRSEEIFAQQMISPETSWLVDSRWYRQDTHWPFIFFDRSVFDKTYREQFPTHENRVGLRYQLDPDTTIIATAAQAHVDDDSVNVDGTGKDTFDAKEQLASLEARLFASDRLGPLTFGGSTASGDDRLIRTDPESSTRNRSSLRQGNAFLYQTLLFGRLALEPGISVDYYSDRSTTRTQVNPKFGLEYEINQDTTIRAALARILKRAVINSQTIEPVVIAGFNQFYDDYNGADVWRYSLGIDSQINRSLRWGTELSYSNHDLYNTSGALKQDNQREIMWSNYLYIVMGERSSLNIGYEYWGMDASSANTIQQAERISLHMLPVEIRYFVPQSWTFQLRATAVAESGRFPGASCSNVCSHSDQGVVLDAGISRELIPGRAAIVLDAFNLLDSRFRFEDVDPANSRVRLDRAFLLRLLVDF